MSAHTTRTSAQVSAARAEYGIPQGQPLGGLIRPMPAPISGATLKTEVVKRYEAFSVVAPNGSTVATSHVVQVKLDLYTVLVNGVWMGNVPKTTAVAHLAALCA